MQVQIVRTRADLGDFVLSNPGPVFFVPTMGFLHEGHASLLRMAAEDRDSFSERGTVVMSLFVNPTKFNNPSDLNKYPRDEARDTKIAKKAGCDLIFAPSVEEVYPHGVSGTTVCVSTLSERWEGEHRQGNFDGVATVVNKLFNIVLPDYAYFGEKDWQQCAVISKMVSDLDMQVWLKFVPTVRESDGLAMSSRNSFLRDEFRHKAPLLHQLLVETSTAIKDGNDPRKCEKDACERLLLGGFSSIDYFVTVDEVSLEPISEMKPGSRILAAATIGGVRLIDNVSI